MASVAIEIRIQNSMSSSARIPKKMTPQTAAGSRASSTSPIIFCVVIPLRTCGEGETVNNCKTDTPFSLFHRCHCHGFGELVGFSDRTFCRTGVCAAAAVHAQRYMQCLQGCNIFLSVRLCNLRRHQPQRTGMDTASTVNAGGWCGFLQFRECNDCIICF